MKLDAKDLGVELEKLGFGFFSGVPCSFLSDLINYAINDADFVMSSNEGDAVAISAGAYLAGKKSVVLMQNSGLTNAISPLTSLNFSFRLPVLGFVSLRGEPGLGDEPQHELMGTITEKMLELIQVEWEYLSSDIDEVKKQLARADETISNNKTFFFIVKKGTLNKVELKEKPNSINHNRELSLNTGELEPNTRLDILEALNESADEETVLLATTGKTGRELYEVEDRNGNLYMVGSMGSISSIGLGIALNSDNKVVAIDGDGALLMRMGNLGTNGFYAPDNLLHILIDNNSHDSTGGQFTVSHNVDFVKVAADCGYTRCIYIHSIKEFKSRYSEWSENPVLTFFYIKVTPGTKENLGRPTIKPYEVKNRLIEYING